MTAYCTNKLDGIQHTCLCVRNELHEWSETPWHLCYCGHEWKDPR